MTSNRTKTTEEKQVRAARRKFEEAVTNALNAPSAPEDLRKAIPTLLDTYKNFRTLQQQFHRTREGVLVMREEAHALFLQARHDKSLYEVARVMLHEANLLEDIINARDVADAMKRYEQDSTKSHYDEALVAAVRFHRARNSA